jgi:hypothetical protein
MAYLSVEIADDLLASLQGSADSSGRTLQQEVEYSLRSTFPRQDMSNESLREIAERISAMTPKGVKQTDSLKILRAHRDGTAIED